jgi:F0F1-type ATP synthase assembly protein I
MDFKFRYNRRPQSAEAAAQEQRLEADREKRMQGLAMGLTIPTTLLGGVVGGWLLGSLLDRWQGTTFWMPTLIILGTVAGMSTTILLLSRLNKK